ncbi:MAG: proline dehydrogenase family protein [Rhodospirillales bacterium]|nr:proline dehydrogenase family protein [Rhodospirillales bacterium]
MKLWQGAMIGLARSGAITRFMQDYAPTSRLASRFVGGAEVGGFIETAKKLRISKLSTSAFFLGEYVTDPGKIEANIEGILAAIAEVDGSAVDLHVSIDPSQIGYAIDDGLGEENAVRIAEALAAKTGSGRKTLMLDMEDHSYVSKTIALHDKLIDSGFPTAITLQAYLRRSAGDLHALVSKGAMVRLVKGAFVGDSGIAFRSRKEIDASYRRLGSMLLSEEAKNAGVRPVFGTHDHLIIEALCAETREVGWRQGDYEFEMLYGVRPALQRTLADAGEAVRLYLPFGRDWWPYAVRRVGESPRNAWLVFKALVSRR